MIIALIKMSIFRIPLNHLGLPESIFKGRFKKTHTDVNGIINYTLIHKPYREGFHIKPFWWRIYILDQKVCTRAIERREYQTSTTSVFISGVVEWRYSYSALFRVPETRDSIEAGLNALIDDLLSKEAAKLELEQCITRKGELNVALRKKLTQNTNPAQKVGDIQLKESEAKYGIEILTVHISLVEPSEEVKESRDERQREKYEKESQTTERSVLRSDMNMWIKAGVNPNLGAKLAMERQGKLPEGMTDERIDVDAPDNLTGLIGGFLSKLGNSSKKDGGSNS